MVCVQVRAREDEQGSVQQFHADMEETASYGGGAFKWYSVDEICSDSNSLTSHLANKGKEIEYPENGYFEVLEAPAMMDKAILEQRITALQEQAWVDHQTAAVFIKFSIVSSTTQCSYPTRAQYTVLYPS